MLRTNMNEMNVQPIDLGDELRQGLQPGLDLAPIVICRPIICEFLHRRELHALRLICDGLLLGPARGSNAPAEVDERLFRNVDAEGADRVVGHVIHGEAPEFGCFWVVRIRSR